jgi:hypothetical protein
MKNRAALITGASSGIGQARVVADAVLKAADAAHPKVRHTAGGLAGGLRFLRTFMPASMADAGLRKDLRL